jgi:hypothetical protein
MPTFEELKQILMTIKEIKTDLSELIISTTFNFTVNNDLLSQCIIVAMAIFIPSAGQRLCVICVKNKGIKISIIRYIFRLFIFPIFLVVFSCCYLYLDAISTIKVDYQPYFIHLQNAWLDRGGIIIIVSILAAVFAIIARYFIAYKIEPIINQWLIGGTKRGSRDCSITDVSNIENYLPNIKQFNPEHFFKKAFKKNSIFLGIEKNNTPIFLDIETYKKSNVMISGPSGSGKGIQGGVVACQGIKNGYATFIIDPKCDEWAPSVFSSTCEKSNKPFILLDIRDGKPAQFNPFQGAKDHDLNELLSSALSLGRKGEAADHYRNIDRKSLRILTKENPKSIYELINSAPQLLGNDLLKQSQGLLDQLEELASITSIQTLDNNDVMKNVINKGGCLYIIGSTRSEATLMLQKMLFIRIVQLVEKRDRGGRHVTVFADEVKYHLSAPLINALGTVRDKGMNILMALQSLGDLENCGSDLDPKTVRQTVLDNTPLKWIYRTKDIDGANWASKLTGTTIVDNETREVEVNEADCEILSSERKIIQSERNLYDTNIIQNLPDRCALSIGQGRAKLAFSYPMKVTIKNLQLLNATILKRVNIADELLSNKGEDLL